MKIRKGILLCACCFLASIGVSISNMDTESVRAASTSTDARMFVCSEGLEMEDAAFMPQYVYDAYDNMITQYNRTGLKVTVKEQGASFRYNSIVNLNDLSAGTDIFQILVAPEVQDALEINNIEFKLTDIYDESNFITIKASAFSGQAIKNLTEILVYDAEGEAFVMQSSETRAVSSWRGDVITLRDQAKTQVINPFSFSINPETLDFYIASTHAGADSILRTLKYKLGDQETQGNRAVKFATNEVYVDVKINTLSAPDGSFWITKFLGKDLTGTPFGAQNVNFIVEDTKDANEVLPYGVVGMEYRIPQTQVYAFGVEPMMTEISIIDELGKVFFPGKNAFTPKKEGKYIISYTAPIYGTTVEHRIPLEVKKQYEHEIVYEIEDMMAISGETFIVNLGNASGGNGTLKTEVKLFQGETPIELKKSGSITYFIPVTGTYTIKHYVSDYLQTKVYEQTITTIEKCVFEEVYVPQYIMANRTYTLQKPVASIVKGGELIYAESEMYVNGVKADNLRLSVDESAVITFKAILEGVTYESKEYTVVSKSDKASTYYLENFFDVKSGSILIDSTLGLQADAEGNAKADFLMPISNRNLLVAITPKQFLSGEAVVVFQDGGNADKQIELSIKKNETLGGTTISANGEMIFVSTDSLTGTTFNLSIGLDGSIYNGETKIGKAAEWLSGYQFDGFSEWVYVFIEMRNAGETSSLLMNKIGNQTISNQKSDRIAPYLELQRELPNNLYIKQNETQIFPMAYAYDVLQGNAYIYLWVRDGEGNILFDDLMTEDYTFTAETLGEYWLGYYVYDREGKKGNENFFQVYIQVTTSTMPTVTLGSEIPTTVAVNTEFKIPTIQVNSSLETKYYVYLIAPDYTNFKVEGNTVTFSQEGTYIIRIIGLDAEGNMVVKDNEVVVTQASSSSSGCKSDVGIAFIPMLLIASVAMVVGKKKEKDNE